MAFFFASASTSTAGMTPIPNSARAQRESFPVATILFRMTSTKAYFEEILRNAVTGDIWEENAYRWR